MDSAPLAATPKFDAKEADGDAVGPLFCSRMTCHATRLQFAQGELPGRRKKIPRDILLAGQT
jgi:hypothetical protein